MVITVAVGRALLRGIHLVKPVISNHLSGCIVDQTSIGISGVGVRLDAPVRIADVFFDRLLAIHPSIALIQAADLLALNLVQEAVLNEVARRIESTFTHQLAFDGVLNLLHRHIVLVLQGVQYVGIDHGIILLLGGMERLFDGLLNLVGLKAFAFSVALDDFDHIE